MNIIRLRGKIKGLLLLFRIDWFVPSRLFNFLAQIAKLSNWIRKNNDLEKCDFYTYKFDHSKRYELFEFLIEKEDLTRDIDYLEFGVSTGNSFRWWIEKIKDENSRFYGFDTFTGLPEDWGPYKKGDMSNGNKPPEIDDNRHEFFQGLFQQTLVKFLAEYKSNKRKIIHMDADIYTATLYVLTLMTPYMRSGDVILFDEFNVPMHEFKAFTEWADSFMVEYEVLGSVNNFYQTAIKIKSC
jgi:O-methyltransferase